MRAVGAKAWVRPAYAAAVRAGSTISRPGGVDDIWGAPANEYGVGTANLEWESLGFDYVPTVGHYRHLWKDGEWEPGFFREDPYLTVHLLGNVFHYGQSIFEGFKVFHTRLGTVESFSDHLCHERMSHGCRRFRMPVIPKKMWQDAINETVRRNVKYVPPYGTGGSLYVRPFIFGSGPRLGLGPAPEYTFVVMCNPAGSYYKAGKMQALDGLVNDEYDRAAPLGCGDVKAAGNYAADLESMYKAKHAGYPISLYLDARERRYIEEFNTSNFVAITKDGKYITPDSARSVLNSNTNKCLRVLAADMGLTVEVRPIDFEKEVDTFAEVGAVGTAVVVTPIKSLTRGNKTWSFQDANVLVQLHDKVRAIQNGEEVDMHRWMRKIPMQDERDVQMMSIYPGL